MTLWERLQLAWHSELGLIMLGLLSLLVVLSLLYWVLAWRQARADKLVQAQRDYYTRCLALESDQPWETVPRVEFFGRALDWKDETEAGAGLMLAPQIATPDVLDALAQFYQALSPQKIRALAGAKFSRHNEHTLLVHRASGKMTLYEAIQDQALSKAEIEAILLNLAQSLAKLHAVHGPHGERYYHGFLVPSHCSIERDDTGTARAILWSDAGYAWALGPEWIAKMMQELEDGKHRMMRYDAQRLLDQLPLLAPEQRDASLLSQVGQAVDYYAFGMIACSLWQGKLVSEASAIDWNRVPLRWKRFLESCLDASPKGRPCDFLELEDWLNDPELSLTQAETETEAAAPVEELGSDSLVASLDRVRKRNSEQRITQLEAYLSKGQRAVESGRWTLAREAFERAELLDDGHPDVHVGLAICAYEAGDLKDAEHHYRRAKAKDRLAARRFREHLTFKT